jgi:hypothetical protein
LESFLGEKPRLDRAEAKADKSMPRHATDPLP